MRFLLIFLNGQRIWRVPLAHSESEKCQALKCPHRESAAKDLWKLIGNLLAALS